MKIFWTIEITINWSHGEMIKNYQTPSVSQSSTSEHLAEQMEQMSRKTAWSRRARIIEEVGVMQRKWKKKLLYWLEDTRRKLGRKDGRIDKTEINEMSLAPDKITIEPDYVEWDADVSMQSSSAASFVSRLLSISNRCPNRGERHLYTVGLYNSEETFRIRRYD